MANVHTELPKQFGEHEVALSLCKLDDPRLHLWFNVDYLPGVGDIDLILWHELHGVFLIEIKAVPFSAIEDIDFKHVKISGRSATSSPHYQAYQALMNLKDFFRGRGFDSPYIIPTALFSKIARTEWQLGVADERLRGSFSESVLFAEDFQSAESLRERLAAIWRNPPVGRRLGQQFQYDPTAFTEFSQMLRVRAHREASRSDQNRIQYLESQMREAADRDAPADQIVRLAYIGYPGTGKTFRLLRIAIQHALAGKRVLFLCFNKVLAADVRRLISLSQGRNKLEAYDLFDLLERLREFNGIARFSRPSYDEYAAALVERLADSLPLAYDTILIDEAQDLKPWAVDFITRLSRRDSSVIVSMSRGQELYSEARATFDQLNLKDRQLRRVFRNPRRIFQFAHTIYETRLKAEHVKDVVTRRFSKVRSDDSDQPLFQREGGEFPTIVELEGVRDAGHSSYRTELGRIVQRAVERMLSNGASPHDVLLLVPGKSPEYEAAVECLQRTSQKAIDLVRKENRRAIAPPDAVRLSTFHSSRGIEAEHVIVLGLPRVAQQPTSPENLAYVALSRATASSEIVLTESDLQDPIGRLAILTRDELRKNTETKS